MPEMLERTIMLVNEDGDVRIPAPVGPYSPDDSPNQSTTLSGGKVMRVTSFGENEYIYPMRLRNLDKDVYDRILNFITANLRLTSNSCQIVDHQGTKHNMYYISGLETTSVNDGDLYSVALRFQQGLSDPVKIGTRVGDFDLSLGRVRTTDD